MTIAVDFGRKATKPTNNQTWTEEKWLKFFEHVYGQLWQMSFPQRIVNTKVLLTLVWVGLNSEF